LLERLEKVEVGGREFEELLIQVIADAREHIAYEEGTAGGTHARSVRA
jgi:hypothetical protein